MNVIAAVLATAAIGFPTTPDSTLMKSVYADLNGDGLKDYVTVESVPGNQNEQILSARVGAQRLTARLPLDSPVGVQPMGVVDLDGDGRKEVVVTESLGANTSAMGVWGLYGGRLGAVRTGDGAPLLLWDGGGASAINRYGCTADHDGRQLVTVGAQAVDIDFTVFEGEFVVYEIEQGIATETARVPVTGPRDAPGFQADATLCL